MDFTYDNRMALEMAVLVSPTEINQVLTNVGCVAMIFGTYRFGTG